MLIVASKTAPRAGGKHDYMYTVYDHTEIEIEISLFGVCTNTSVSMK